MLEKLSLKQKLLSGILTLCAVVSFVVGAFVLQARAADSNLSYDQYKADYYISVGYDRYLSSDFTLPYRSIVEGNRNNIAYQGLINAWQIATFNLSDTVQLSKRKAGIYETFLFDILYKGNDPTNMSEMLNKVVKAVESSTMKKVCEFTGEELPTYIRMNLSTMDKNQIEKLGSALKSCDELKGVFKSISTISNVLEYATDVEDLIYKLCKASVIAKLGNEYADVLNAVSNRTNDQSMKYACTELASICNNMMTEEQIIALMSSELLATDLTEWALGEIWDKVLENCTSYGLAIKVGQGLGKFFSKILFSTDKVIENYYEMDALYDFENNLKEVVKSYKSSYSSSKTENNAKHFNAAYEMLLGVYGLGTDVSLEHARINNEDGVNLFVSYVMNKHDKYEIFKNTMKIIKDELIFIKDYANGDLYNSYLEECCTTISSVISLTPVTLNASQEQFEQTYEDLTQNIILLGDRRITKDMTLSSDYETFGNLYFSGGTINLNGQKMTIYGNLNQTGGTLCINGGTLNIDKDYNIRNSNTDGSYSYSNGKLVMNNENDEVNINGNFYAYLYNSCTLSDGTMNIGGDVSIYHGNSGTTHLFSPTDFHKVVLNGTAQQTIVCASKGDGFNILKMNNADVVFKCSLGIKGFKAANDVILDTSKGNSLSIDGTIDLNGHNLIVDNTLNFVSGTINLNGGHMIIAGDLKQAGTVYINGGEVHVAGTLNQTNGSMSLGGGKLQIDEDYNIRNSNTDGSYSSCSGNLVMRNKSDYILTKGSFYDFSSSSSSILTNGIMEIHGDFSCPSIYFRPSESHTVILNGNNVQNVCFASPSSKFYNLKLTKDFETGYVFNPNNCWTNLYLESNVDGVTISSPKSSVYQDESVKLTAKVTGINNPSQLIIWSISGNTDNATTISEKDLLSVGLNEQASTIIISATSVEDNTKSANIEINVLEVERVIEGLFVTPSKVSTVCGETCSFFAYVYGIYGPSQEVTWTISGNNSQNTTINPDGELTIAEDETTDKITVTATSTVDPTKSANVIVDIYQIKITSTVSNVTVTMAAGETQKLQAVVTGTNNPNQKVIWSVGGNESSNTFINENGELTVGNDETAKTIIVRATSVEDPEKYGEFAVNIATSDEPKYQIGDTNLDGHITVSDVTAIQRHIAELEVFTDEQLALADTNGDGSIDITDATHLQKYLAEFDGVVLGKS